MRAIARHGHARKAALERRRPAGRQPQRGATGRAPGRALAWLAAVIVALAAGAPALAAPGGVFTAQAGATLIVAAEGPYTTIQAALAAAQPGDTIQVQPGTYAGPVVVETERLTLEGVGWPVIDGGGVGTVVSLLAPGVVFRGFEVRGSGVEPDRDHGGLLLAADHITAENNRLTDVLFGIFVAEADYAVVRGNEVTSKPEYDLGRKGDGIRLWYSQGVVVEANHVHAARDLVAWYSQDFVLRGNVVENGRYGIHLMYCDRAVVERNTFRANSVGIYTMYSAGVVLRDNDIRGQRGPSGYALGFKDADGLEVTGNLLADNRAGVYLDGTPFRPGGLSLFEGNLIAFNDVGIIAQPAVRGNTFTNNTFWENVQQVAVQGGGQLAPNAWDGNYWSDYSGYDAHSNTAGPAGAASGPPDGVGDTPYRSERLFESMMDREPMLRALLYSPAVDAIEMAAAAFPVVRPEPKLADTAPRLEPLPVPVWVQAPRAGGRGLAWAALGLLAASVAVGLVGRGPAGGQGEGSMRHEADVDRVPGTSAGVPAAGGPAGHIPAQPAIRAERVSKRYGRVPALEGVSFAAEPGEAVALWGANGAGKSTLLKAMLGLIEFDGRIHVAGHDVRRSGKQARGSIGYVPQEAVFYDQSVMATMAFYARLKQVRPERIAPLLERLGLADHVRKPVPALSGGLKQRLALAVALLSDPAVLLLDEPTANLDAQAQSDYLELLHALRTRENKTIIFASHRLEEVEAVANRVLVLEHGRLVASLTPLELLARLMPEIELTLWVPEAQRADALSTLAGLGWPAHFNGRGTVVVRVRAEQKLRALQALQARGIAVQDFELTRGAAWS